MSGNLAMAQLPETATGAKTMADGGGYSRIYPYISNETKERFYNACDAMNLQMSHVIEDLILGWVEEQEQREWVWTDPKTKEVMTKPAGDPFPARRRRKLPSGRPQDS